MLIPTRLRRQRLLVRHHLAAEHPAGDTVQATRGVLVLHATDPATIHLSVLARVPGSTVPDVAVALHEDRSVLRMMAMRRTLFVAALDDASMIHTAASTQIAAKMWKGILKDLTVGVVTPPLDGADPQTWLTALADETAAVIAAQGPLAGTEVAALVPGLRTAISDPRSGFSQALTSRILAALGADGRIVRGRTQGGWTSTRHRWEPSTRWWPDGLTALDPEAARTDLVRRYLERFGPVTLTDVQWWTGWTLGHTRAALAALDLVEVELGTGPGLVLATDPVELNPVGLSPVANLLPALDPTPMGWKDRDWLFDVDPVVRQAELYDRNGNVGPTIWWNGGVVGGWAPRPDGSLATRLLVDIGADGTAAVAGVAADLEQRLAGATVVPSFRTPLERELAGSPR